MKKIKRILFLIVCIITPMLAMEGFSTIPSSEEVSTNQDIARIGCPYSEEINELKSSYEWHVDGDNLYIICPCKERDDNE